MVPGTYKVDQVRGQARRVSMTLEVEPVDFTIITALFNASADQVSVIAQPVGALDLQVLFTAGDTVQIQGAGVNNGVNTPIDLDGLYEVLTVPTPAVMVLDSPELVNSAWTTLGTYPSSLSGNIVGVCLVRVPL